jgi:hypothetical protein
MPKHAAVNIRLELEGDQADAEYVVGDILDSGMIQDAINENDLDAGVLKVTSAAWEPAALEEITEEEDELLSDALDLLGDAYGYTRDDERPAEAEDRRRRLALLESVRAKLGLGTNSGYGEDQ